MIPTEYAMEMIKVVLDNNNFSLGDKHFLQKGGVAIGSRLGRNFACSFMRKWDEKLLEFETEPYFYKRYIDDGFGIWTAGLDSLLKFADFANNIHGDIKLELRWSKEEIVFLDTMVKIAGGQLYTDLHIKPTDKQLYIQQKSCHPTHTKQSLAYSLGLRIKRICENEEDYRRHRSELKFQLRKRGYSGRSIETQLQKVDRMDRLQLLQKDINRQKTDRVPLVLTYSKSLPDIRAILRKHQDTLFTSERMQDIFPKPPLLAFRKDRNICDTLVHSKTNRALRTTEKRCACEYCTRIVKSDISDTASTKSYPVQQDVDCSTRNLIYCLLCNRCNVTVYVGETERSLKERLTEHLRDVRNRADKPINRHFENHSAADVRISVLAKMFNGSKISRLLHEEIWIKLLNTKFPNGCNVKVNL